MRRTLRIFAWALGGSALLALLLGGGMLVAGNTDAGRRMIERLTLELTSGHVSLSGLNGSFPQRLTLERLELRDAGGVWLTADEVSVDWSPLALLERRIQVGSLHAAGVDMERLPQSSSNPASTGPASIPRIDVASLSVDRVKLGAALAGKAATLRLRGNAHLRSAEDMIIEAAARRIDGDGDYELQLRFDPRRMDASLNLHEPAGGPLENLLQLPGLGALAATVKMSGPRTAERLVLSIDAGALHGSARGSLNFNELSADLDFALDSPALAPRSDLSWEHASVHGRWHGSIKSPRADGHIDIGRLRLPGGVQLAALNGELSAESGRATLHAVIAGLRIPGPRPQLLEDAPVTLDASMRLDSPTRPLDVSASHRLFSLRAAAETAAPKGAGRSATAELRLPNLGELAALAGQNVRGSALVKAQLRDDGVAVRVVLDANASLHDGTEFWSGVVGERAGLQLSGRLTDGAITVESAKLTGRAGSLTASGDVSRPRPGAARQNPQSLRARWDLDISDLKTVSPALAGTLKASGTLAGALTALAGEARLTSTLSVRDSPSGTVSAEVKVRGLPSSPSGTLVAQGTLDGAPVHLDAALERGRAGSLRALIRRADWKSAHADGEFTVAADAAQTHGELRLQMGQLADLQDLLGTKVGGSLAGTVVVHPAQGASHAQLHFDARDLTVQQFTGNAQLTADGAADALGFKLEVQVPELRGTAASLSAAGTLNLGARKIALTSAALKFRGQEVRLLSPAQIALANGVSVDVFKVGAQAAVFQLKGDISPSLDVRASLRQLQPSLVNAFVPGLLASGTIEARARLKGSLAAPTGQLRLTATDMALADDAAFGLPSLDLHATAELSGDTADVDARLDGRLGVETRASPGGRRSPAEGALDFKISGSLDVGMINPLLEARGQHAAGELSVDATVGGSVAAPQIDGTVNLSKGSVRDYARGRDLTDITAAIVGNEGTLQIKSMTATAAPGTVSMTGSVGVLQPGMPVDLRIKARERPAAGEQIGDGESQRGLACQRDRARAARRGRDGAFEPHADRNPEQPAAQCRGARCTPPRQGGARRSGKAPGDRPGRGDAGAAGNSGGRPGTRCGNGRGPAPRRH